MGQELTKQMVAAPRDPRPRKKELSKIVFGKKYE